MQLEGCWSTVRTAPIGCMPNLWPVSVSGSKDIPVIELGTTMAALDALKEENSKLKSEVDELNEYKETVEKEKVETAASEIFNDFENELSGVDEFSLLKSIASVIIKSGLASYSL